MNAPIPNKMCILLSWETVARRSQGNKLESNKNLIVKKTKITHVQIPLSARHFEERITEKEKKIYDVSPHDLRLL